jgi:hypothetical protein
MSATSNMPSSLSREVTGWIISSLWSQLFVYERQVKRLTGSTRLVDIQALEASKEAVRQLRSIIDRVPDIVDPNK